MMSYQEVVRTAAGNKILAIDKVTMKVVGIFKSAAACARALGIDNASVCNACNRRSVPRGELLFRFGFDYDPDESFDGKYNRPVTVTDSSTGEAVSFCDSGRAAAWIGAKDATVKAAICKGNKVNGRYEVRYTR